MSEQGNTPGSRRGYAGTWPPQGAAPAGGLFPSRLGIWPPLIETLRQWARAEERGRWLCRSLKAEHALVPRIDSEPVGLFAGSRCPLCCRPDR